VLRETCEAGAFKPVIDSRYPLARIAEAHARADSGRTVGNVVVTMDAA
jgi:NADPH:quinone reductase-like Zn-dependent oxidoreductase